MSGPAGGAPIRESGFLEQAGKPDEKDGTDDRDNDGADEAARVNAEQTHQPATNHRADDAEDNVHHCAVTAAFHDLAGGPARDKAHNDPPNQIRDHVECSFPDVTRGEYGPDCRLSNTTPGCGCSKIYSGTASARDSCVWLNQFMFARKIRVEYDENGRKLPCPLKWLDSFSMRSFTNFSAFDDTLPVADGEMEIGSSVPL